MWTATVDFTKAFDSICHKSIWDALKSCNIDHEYVSLLRKTHKDQKASVQTDEESNIFDNQKESKQGELEICRLRDAICNLQRTGTENDV